MNNQQPSNNERDEYYRETWEYLDKERTRDYGTLDKIIFALATGTLVLSINFVFGITRELTELPILFAAWLFLVLSILSHLFSYLFALRGIQKAIHTLEQWYESSDEYFEPNMRNLYYRHVHIANTLALSSLIIGIILLTIFAINNIV